MPGEAHTIINEVVGDFQLDKAVKGGAEAYPLECTCSYAQKYLP